ncbi:MAG: undecaprenyl-phosphate galactose phosphotransferase WbaP [Thiohalocapsa sp.]|nr:undecaprenyl-phosphate galactose phosphotransferase WbaP [Thiohalocapsa sp.]
MSAVIEALTPSKVWVVPRRGIATVSLVLTDFAALLLAGATANVLHWLYLGPSEHQLLGIWLLPVAEQRIAVALILLLIAQVWFWALGHYTRRRPFWDELAEIFKVIVGLALIDAAVLYLLKLPFSRAWFLGTWLLTVPLIPMLRTGTKRLLLHFRVWQRPTIVLGDGDNAADAVAAIRSEPLMGIDVIGVARVTSAPAQERPEQHIMVGPARVPVMPLSSALQLLSESPEKPSLVVALDRELVASEVKLIRKLQRMCGEVSVVPPLRGLPLYGAKVNHFFRHDLFFLSLRNQLSRHGARLVKRTFDIVGSVVLILLCAPFLIYCAVGIALGGGPVLFAQTRIGQNGKPFHCYKFRTMVRDAEQVLARLLESSSRARAEWHTDQKLRNDPRVTPIGRFLRAYSLDELPQLWNVLTGEMSLVGPRPIVDSELSRYGDFVDEYLAIRPGMTGLWQISGRNDSGYEQRVFLDSWYVKNWSLWYDLVILMKTFSVVLKREGAY